MMRLLGVEVRRLLARRLFRVLTILAIAGFLFAGFIAFINSGASGTGFAYRDLFWVLVSVGMPLIMLGWLVGASAVGAEWANRTMTTTLTWESRRTRVLVAKILSVAVITFVWILVLQAILSAVMYPVAALRGSTDGLDLDWWIDAGRVALSISVVGAIAAVVGAAIATVGRHTAAALGVGFVYLAVVEGLIRGFKPAWIDWLVGENALVVIVGDLEINPLSHSPVVALFLLLAYAALLSLAATAVFQRRDLT
jgi:ABC-type transport system involved in multi-copper enzyme maturation permease subunit